MRKPRSLAVAACVCGFVAAGAFTVAQEEAQERFAAEVEVTEVLLDVLVTDKRGQVIIGLGKDDFLVEEEGDPVELTGVTFYSSRELLGSRQNLERDGLSVDEVEEGRHFIIFFQQQQRVAGDVPGLMSRQMEAARDLETWIAQDLQASDLVAVVAYDTRLTVLQDFSRNRAALQDAVGQAAEGRGGELNWPSRQPELEDGPSLSRQLPVGKDLRKKTGDIYKALQVTASAAGSIRGRKNLIFIGRGIGETNSFGVWEPDSRYYAPTIEALNDNNVAVYPLDLMPLGSRHTLEQSLSALANDTGGTFTRQFTSFLTPLEQISKENGGYYLLSYQSRKPRGQSGYQTVKVKTRNPELKVRARQGYLFGG
jgi:VWFA-related protein